MNDPHFVLSNVAKILDRKPHQVTYALTSGAVPEPKDRLANRRLFTREDVTRLARHFKVAPAWSTVEVTHNGDEGDASPGLVLKAPYEVLQVSETGHEIRDGDGTLFAWAADRGRALLMAGLLEAAARG
jgi:hypothetical protein